MPNKEQFAVVAWVGNLAEVLGIFKKLGLLTGIGGVALAFVCSFYTFVWGLLERNNTKAKVRALAIVSLVLGFALFLCFSVVGFVLLIEQTPSPSGFFVGRNYETLQLKEEFRPGQKSAEHILRFSSKADIATVIFAPSDEDRGRVSRLVVYPASANGASLTKLVRSDPKEDGLLIEKAALASPIEVRVSAMLDNNIQADKIQVIVTYEYARRNWKWKLIRWVFEEYS